MKVPQKKRSEFDKVRLDRAAVWITENNLNHDVDNPIERAELFQIYSKRFRRNRRNKFYWKHAVEAARILKKMLEYSAMRE